MLEKKPRDTSDFFVNSSQSKLPNIPKSLNRSYSRSFKLKSTKSSEKYQNFQFLPYKVEDFLKYNSSKRTESTRSSLQKVPSYQSLTNSQVKRKIRVKARSPALVLRSSDFSPSRRPHSRLKELKELLTPIETQGLCQLEAKNLHSLNQLLETSAEKRENCEKIEKISKNIIVNSTKIEEETDFNYSNSGVIDENMLKSLIYQFELPIQLRDYLFIDKTLEHLEFFSKFSQKTRRNILNSCEIVHFLINQTIFRQGDIGYNFFIVIKGSVTVEKNMKGTDEHKMIVTSIYDGKHFGDSTFISNSDSSSKYRQSTCIASEDSYCFQIDKNEYRSILIEDQKEEIDQKMQFLSKIHIFSRLENDCLTNLATYLPLLTYKLGDIILHQGEIPKGLHIIVSGNAKLYVEGFKLQGIITPFMNANKKNGFPPNIQKTIIKKILINNIGPLTQETIKKIKFFVPEYENLSKNKGYVTKDYLEFGTLHSRDYFGGRVLLDEEEQREELNSKFTVVVTTAELTLMVLDKSILTYFSDKIVAKIKTEISDIFEIDCPGDIQPAELDQCLVDWQNFKKELTESIYREKFVERYKAEYPFIR